MEVINKLKKVYKSISQPEWFYRSGSIKVEKFGNGFFYSMDAKNNSKWQMSDEDLLTAYLEIPEVSSIINYKARAFSQMDLRAVVKSTGEDYTGGDSLARLFDSPNWFQGKQEFLRQTKIFRELFGNEYIYFNVPFGMDIARTKGVFTLPSYMVEIKPAKEQPMFYTVTDSKDLFSYYFTFNTREGKKEFPLDYNLINHLNDNRVKFDPENYLKGTSGISTVSINIANLRAAYEARNILISNRGALGILSNDQTSNDFGKIPFDDDEKKEIEAKLRSKRYDWIITNLGLKWQQINQSVDELKLFEETKDDTKKVCEALGVPAELFLTETTFDNKKQADKQLYQNTIIPEAQEWVNSMNVMCENDKRSWEWVCDYSNLPALQEDRRLNAQTFTTAMAGFEKAINLGIMTVDEAKEELNKFV
jgi:phage portal protein BeeE